MNILDYWQLHESVSSYDLLLGLLLLITLACYAWSKFSETNSSIVVVGSRISDSKMLNTFPVTTTSSLPIHTIDHPIHHVTRVITYNHLASYTIKIANSKPITITNAVTTEITTKLDTARYLRYKVIIGNTAAATTTTTTTAED